MVSLLSPKPKYQNTEENYNNVTLCQHNEISNIQNDKTLSLPYICRCLLYGLGSVKDKYSAAAVDEFHRG